MQILMKGGNAFDAAVAVGATLDMMEPQMNGLGGNGFMTLFDKKTGKVHSLAMAGAAPKGIKAAEMTPATLNSGINAGIVPGNFGGYLAVLERLGTMSLAEVLAPAIDYAEHGYPIDPSLATAIDRAKAQSLEVSDHREGVPAGRTGTGRGRAVQESRSRGDAEESRRGRTGGAEAEEDAGGRRIQAAFDRFYKGDIAQEFERFFKENGGVMTAADLAAYKPEWQEPVHTTYRGYDVYSNPATSRGGIELVMQLNLLEGYDLAKMGANSPEALHLMIEAIKVAKTDIYKYVGDPKFTQAPTAGLLSKSYAEIRRKLIDPTKAMAYPTPGEPAGSPATAAALDAMLQRPPAEPRPAFDDDYEMDRDTTSFSIVDQFGNGVGCTPTLGGGFGNSVVVGNTGLLLNNGMRLGSTSPYPDNVNYVRGGQIPLLNNSPAVVVKDGKLAMVFGTPGGETIGQTEFQMLVNVVDFKLPVQQAVESPRFVIDAEAELLQAGVGGNRDHRAPRSGRGGEGARSHGPQDGADVRTSPRRPAACKPSSSTSRRARCWPAPIRAALDTRSAGSARHHEHLRNVAHHAPLRVWMKVSHEKSAARRRVSGDAIGRRAGPEGGQAGRMARLRRRSGRDEVLPAHADHQRHRRPPRSWRGSGRPGEAPRPEFGTTPGAFQNTPLMIDDVLYLSTPYNRVVALDAETGQEMWRSTPRRTRTASRPAARASCIAASPRGATATACASS